MTVVSLPLLSVTVDQLPVKTPQAPFESPIASRCTRTDAAFTPAPPPLSVTLPRATGTDVLVKYPAVTVGVGTVGPVMSFVNVSVWLPELAPLSADVTCSVGDVEAPLENAKKLETYGPPVGVVTVLPVNVQPVDVPPSVPNWLQAGPGARAAPAVVS